MYDIFMGHLGKQLKMDKFNNSKALLLNQPFVFCPFFLMIKLGGPFIPLKTGRRDGRRSRADVVEEYLPDHNESISSVLEKFGSMGIDTPGVVALLGIYMHLIHVHGIGMMKA